MLTIITIKQIDPTTNGEPGTNPETMKEFVKVDSQNNRIELLDSRFYMHEPSGQFFPSVTTILEAYPKSQAFFEWLKVAGEKADEIRDSFGKRGSTVHHLTELYDQGFEVSLMSEHGAQYTSQEWAMFERYVDFSTRFNPEILLIEANYCIPSLGFGGTLDRVIILNGKRTLIDIKTSNAVHNHYWLQMAAYAKMFEAENPGVVIEDLGILWLNSKHRTEGKKDSIQGIGWSLVRPEKTIADYWNLFRATHALWKEENGSLKPKNLTYQLTHKKNGN